eukprot:m.309319 g.309319  ORF g.309319 m.309319 type:complete len:508 (-) comp15945_c6_seq1:342-1865(-)
MDVTTDSVVRSVRAWSISTSTSPVVELEDCGDLSDVPLLADDKQSLDQSSVEQTHVPLWMKFLAFLCGISTFARTECILMQTLMFARCFDNRSFYPKSSMFMFMPGILVQVLQSRFDQGFNARHTTFKASIFRISSSCLTTVVCIIALIWGIDGNQDLANNGGFVYSMLLVVGIGSSIAFGAFSQVFALFPPGPQAIFFLGTYCPFFIFAPVNFGVGSLCESMSNERVEGWETNWSAVHVFYGMGVLLTILGLISFLAIVWPLVGRRYLILHDSDLHSTYLVGSTQASDPTETSALISRPTRSQRSSSASSYVPNEAVTAVTAAALDTPPELPSTASASPSHVSLKILLRDLWPMILCVFVTTIVNSLVSSLYVTFPYHKYTSLATLLQYDYYICGALGIFLTSFKFFTRLPVWGILALVVTRCVFIPLAFLYCNNKLPVNDFAVIGLNSVFMLSGGYLFSLSFLLASQRYDSSKVRTAASTTINVVYYIAMGIGLGLALGIIHKDD